MIHLRGISAAQVNQRDLTQLRVEPATLPLPA